LLTGQRPFPGWDAQDFLERIGNPTVSARPLREINDNIPSELERICLKALAKRATDRYDTARDLADDLRSFLADANAEHSGNGTRSVPRKVSVIPKGLRSFDAEDADFFLSLLPGPLDRDGLPESIRFWKHRIERREPEPMFRVGLIYGPSGCGKSSLIKAGLLPRLADAVIPIYIEASADQTEARLVAGLVRQCPTLSQQNPSLVQILVSLRRGKGASPGKKVLIVLDQFEQWLHAHCEDAHPQLVDALRQCDGQRVQCILLVRDDFWLAVGRFMHRLEIRLVDGQNCALMDLFDIEHAREVLETFGRAYGRLDDSNPVSSADHSQFLHLSLSGLAEGSKVICIRLALFAEMMKAKPWTPSTLTQVGGTHGVGVAFLEEAFCSPAAPPKHRYHETATRAILKALLPEFGTNIKGHMCSYDELLQASGYVHRREDFSDLMHILDCDVRLISPTDAGEKNEGAERRDDEDDFPHSALTPIRFFQLTHDYLVPALREWLAQKQKETRRGRAQLRLAERTSQWNSKCEDRHLPSWSEYMGIRMLTDDQAWTEPQRRMMKNAGRRYLMRLMVCSIIVALMAWGAYETNGYFQSQALIGSLMRANEDAVLDIVGQLRPYRRWAQPRLRAIVAAEPQTAHERRRQLHARIALVSEDDTLVPRLYESLLEADAVYIGCLCNVLSPYSSRLLGKLWSVLHDVSASHEHRFRAGSALAMYATDSDRWTADDYRFLCDNLIAANPEHQPILRNNLEPLADHLLPELIRLFSDDQLPGIQQAGAANAVVSFGRKDISRLSLLLTEATPIQYKILYRLVAATPDNANELLEPLVRQQPGDDLNDSQRVDLGRRRAGAAITMLRLGIRDKILDVLRVDEDPESLTQFVHRCRERGVTLSELCECLDCADNLRRAKSRVQRQVEDRVLFGLLLALGQFREEDLSNAEREGLLMKLAELYASDPSSAIHGATGWLLRHWGHHRVTSSIDQTIVPYDPEREWFTLRIKPSLL
jgi:hypothetical protein